LMVASGQLSPPSSSSSSSSTTLSLPLSVPCDAILLHHMVIVTTRASNKQPFELPLPKLAEIAAACLHLATKLRECPAKLPHVCGVLARALESGSTTTTSPAGGSTTTAIAGENATASVAPLAIDPSSVALLEHDVLNAWLGASTRLLLSQKVSSSGRSRSEREVVGPPLAHPLTAAISSTLAADATAGMQSTVLVFGSSGVHDSSLSLSSTSLPSPPTCQPPPFPLAIPHPFELLERHLIALGPEAGLQLSNIVFRLVAQVYIRRTDLVAQLLLLFPRGSPSSASGDAVLAASLVYASAVIAWGEVPTDSASDGTLAVGDYHDGATSAAAVAEEGRGFMEAVRHRGWKRLLRLLLALPMWSSNILGTEGYGAPVAGATMEDVVNVGEEFVKAWGEHQSA
jgi:hypothetical protein